MEKIFFFIFYLILHILFIKYNYQIARKLNIFDQNLEIRKIKKMKVPLTGGVFIFISLIINIFLHNQNLFNFYFKFYDFGSVIYYFFIVAIFFLGFCDDKFNLSANLKLLITIILFYGIYFFDKGLLITYLNFEFLNLKFNILSFSSFFVIFCLVVFLNAMNMYDGINLQVISYFIFISIYLLLIEGSDTFIFNLLITCLFFAFLNFKNKAYLGDSGVYLLSSVFAIIIIKFHNMGLLKSDQIFLLMLLPGIDLIRLVATRVIKKKHPFRADNLHFHHLLLKKFNENKSFLINFVLFAVPNTLALIFDSYLFFIFISLIIYSIIFYHLQKHELFKQN